MSNEKVNSGEVVLEAIDTYGVEEFFLRLDLNGRLFGTHSLSDEPAEMNCLITIIVGTKY
jgi:hypothetical protein